MFHRLSGCIGLIVLFVFAAKAETFDTLRSVPADKRVKLARILYKKELRRVDSLAAFKGFEQLFRVAKSLDDHALECSINEFQADYFSVNRGFNSLSPAYYQKAIDLAARYELAAEVAIYTHKKATYYNTFKHYVEAYRFFLEAYSLFKIAGFENIPDISTYLHTQATFLYHIGDIENAQNILLEAVQYEMETTGEKINMTNTLALTFRKLGNDKKALDYFNDGLKMAISSKDSAWIGIISGNIGAIFYDNKNYKDAIPRLELDYKYSLAFGQLKSGTSALLSLAKCHILENHIEKSLALSELSEPLVRQCEDLGLWIAYYDNMALLNEKLNRPEKALSFRKQFDLAKDSLRLETNAAAINRVKLKWEMDKHVAQVNQLKGEADMEVLKRNSIIAVLFLLMIISILAINRQALKRKKEKELYEHQEALLQSEKTRTEAELRNATQALESYTENLKQKNELIEEFKAEIDYLHLQLSSPPDMEKIQHLEKLMQAHIMTDETWNEFKKLFEKVHAGFLFRVKEKFTQATETDIRLLTLVKLGLNNKEMANMLGVTLEAIKKSRQRLKKKINLPEDKTLEEIVISI